MGKDDALVLDSEINGTYGVSFFATGIPTNYGAVKEVTGEDGVFTKNTFERDLKKVSRKRETFFGDNIRDAIKTIKG